MALPPKQQAFIREYLIDLNATKAAARAGYSPRSAKVTGFKLLSTPAVAAAVAAAKAERAERVEVTADDTLRQIDEIASSDLRLLFDDAGALLPPRLWPDEIARAVSSFRVVTKKAGEGEVEHVAEVKLWDKTRALEMKARHLGMFNDAAAITVRNFVVAAEPEPESADQWLEEHAPKAP